MALAKASVAALAVFLSWAMPGLETGAGVHLLSLVPPPRMKVAPANRLPPGLHLPPISPGLLFARPPLKPGFYQIYPYAMIVAAPQWGLDDGIFGRTPAIHLPMSVIHPKLKAVPKGTPAH
ncbi:MAG TPA: hypothetical protein VFB55_06890 [Verrucomicrobiae bacterium]|nr:hypothetical protein [Verrucomicrobiae bacterium]